jgi:hypothetical protein
MFAGPEFGFDAFCVLRGHPFLLLRRGQFPGTSPFGQPIPPLFLELLVLLLHGLEVCRDVVQGHLDLLLGVAHALRDHRPRSAATGILVHLPHAGAGAVDPHLVVDEHGPSSPRSPDCSRRQRRYADGGQQGFGVPGFIKRADQVTYRGIRLPYQKFNRNPAG